MSLFRSLRPLLVPALGLVLSSTAAAQLKNPGFEVGGPGATDNLRKGYETQVWLATSHDEEALITGKFLYHKSVREPKLEAMDRNVQKSYLDVCEQGTGVVFPIN